MTNEELVLRLRRILKLYPDSPSLQQMGLKELVEELELEDRYFVSIFDHKLDVSKYKKDTSHDRCLFVGTHGECIAFSNQHCIYQSFLMSIQMKNDLLKARNG